MLKPVARLGLPLLYLLIVSVFETTVDGQANPQASFVRGQSLADAALAQLTSPPGVQFQANTLPTGYLIAEGDSWFSYPGLDVLGALGGQTLPGNVYYKIYSAAAAGNTVESMAYDSEQLEGFAAEFRKLQDAGKQKELRAIILSGGGNDIAGKEFHVLLNHARGTAGSRLDTAVANAFVDRIGRSLESLIGSAVQFADTILGLQNPKIIIHGYAEPVPDGRPFGIGWPLPGPWLEPAFTAKGYPNSSDVELKVNADVMEQLISMFNKRIAAIPDRLKGVADVRYVDVRAVLSSAIPGTYRADWSNELHPSDDGFKRVAAAIHAAIQK